MRAAVPEPKVWTISSPSMRTAVTLPRSFGGGSTSVGSMMKSLSSTVTPWPASIFSMSSISMPSTFMRPFTGRPRLLIDFACTRIFPSAVASTVPLVLKGMSIFLSSLPFCLTRPFCEARVSQSWEETAGTAWSPEVSPELSQARRRKNGTGTLGGTGTRE